MQKAMWDLIFVLATVAFFAVSLAYVEGCTAVMSTWELILGSAGAVLLTAYLVYALLRPERF